MSAVRRYWDSFCFIAILNNEAEADDCERILDDAKQELTEIIVSPLVQIEVVRPKGSSKPVPLEAREKIRAFFENDYIKWRNTDRTIADRAQALCWTHSVHPRDAVHLATAIETKCTLLETTDGKLLSLNGQLTGISLTIQRPRWVGQPDMFEGSKDD